MTPRARTLVDALAAELKQGRLVAGAGLPKAALVIAVDDPAGIPSQATVLLDGLDVRVREGRFVPPMFPSATLHGTEDALADVLAGRARFADVAAAGALAVDGPAPLLAAFAAHLRSGQSPLQIRLTR